MHCPVTRISVSTPLAIWRLRLNRCSRNHARAVSRAEIAGWLDELLPGHFHKKRQLVELTRRGDTAIRLDEPQPLPQPPLEATTVHPTRSKLSPERPPLAVVRDTEPDAAPPKPPPTMEPEDAGPAARDVGGAALREGVAAAEPPNVDSSERAGTSRADETQKTRDLPKIPPETVQTREPPRRTWLGVTKVAALAALALAGGAFAAYRMQTPSKGATTPVSPDSSPGADREREAVVPEPTDSPAASSREAESVRRASIDPDGEPGTLHILATPGEARIWEGGTASWSHRPRRAACLPVFINSELRPEDGSATRRLEIEIRSGRRVYTSVTLSD